jgi:HAD superfamily 5'-nucleotidase-like hydrolase
MQLPLPLAELQLPVTESILPPRPRRVFCNRSLRLDRVAWVGFDMDYTLAIYRQSEMDRLSIEATARKLVDRGHPEALLTMPYRTDFPVRGLLIDRKLGNVLKMDRYKYVKKAYHGMRELTRDERRQHYHTRRVRPGTKRYHWVDTLYALSEVAVYCAAIEVLEKMHEEIDYDALFTDVRECIDESHRDGSILDQIVSDLPRFVHGDPTLAPTLHKLRSAGKRLFLLTNSHPAYTDRMMSFLLQHGLRDYPSWRHYFDIVVTAACKPLFFTGRERFVDVSNGAARTATTLERGRVYTGGNFLEFEQNLQVRGDQVLYVGDHIYGDVLRAKKESAWRTMMIIQEMDVELEALSACAEAIDRFDSLDEMRNTLYHELRGLQHRLRAIQRAVEHAIEAGEPVPTELDVARVTHKRAMDRLRARIRATEDELHQIEDTIDDAFHPFWGPLFKAGPEVSSFGDQVEEFACLYTDRVSNLLAYSPMHYFRSPRDRMPHER